MKTLTKGSSGFTISEVAVSTVVTSMLFAVLISSSLYIQRSLNAGLHYAERQTQQLRLADYLARDLRNASSVDVTNNQVTITVADYYKEDGTRHEPTISGNRIVYGPNPRTVVYKVAGDEVTRTSDIPLDVDSIVLASEMEDFEIDFSDQQQVVRTEMTFYPKFSLSGEEVQSVRDGTLAVARTLRRNYKK